MKTFMDVNAIIKLKRMGNSERTIAKVLGIDRKTVGKYCRQYEASMSKLTKTKDKKERLKIQENIVSPPKYDSSRRKKSKCTPEFYAELKSIVAAEEEKKNLLGARNKQMLTQKQICEIMKTRGFNVCPSTICLALKKVRGIGQECYIKQKYDYGDRLEYDFGEINLIIDGEKKHYYLAVFTSPASNFRWCYLYENAKKETFLDSHVRFFEMIGGVWREVVYDNMKNVVAKFNCQNSKKQLTDDVIKLGLYYGFDINTTNARAGWEKGSVERSVGYLRNQIFAKNYRFRSVEDAKTFMEKRLKEINLKSTIKEEKIYLSPVKPPLEIASIRQSKVNKCGFVKIDNNYYSVPEYLVNYTVTAKVYRDKILIYSNNELVSEHDKKSGSGEYSGDIRHFLNTLEKKPGSVRNARVLKSNPQLKLMYDKYYSKKTGSFVAIIKENKSASDAELVEILRKEATGRRSPQNRILSSITRRQINLYNKITIGAEK